MHAANALFVLAAAGVATASMMAERVPAAAIHARSVQQGWSIQASSLPAGTLSCGNGSYCPSSLKCNSAANDEVAACCTDSDCRGAIEGAPACADSSWNLWKGLNGNGFCCAADQVGIYDYHSPVAGTCVASAAAAGATAAVLVSTGSAPTGIVTASSSALASTSTAASASSASAAASASASASKAASSASASASAAASASTSASASASAALTGSSTTSAATTSATAKTAGAEKVVSSFAVVVVGLLTALVL